MGCFQPIWMARHFHPRVVPEYFVGSMDNGGPYGAPQDALTLFKFHVDFAVPANSTFTLTTLFLLPRSTLPWVFALDVPVSRS
jgi:hypothetical protein